MEKKGGGEMTVIDRLKAFTDGDMRCGSTGNDRIYAQQSICVLTQDEAQEIVAHIARLEAKVPKWVSAETYPTADYGNRFFATTDDGDTREAYCSRDGRFWANGTRIFRRVMRWMPLDALLKAGNELHKP